MTGSVPGVVEGFVYVSDDRPGPMAGARVGARVTTPSWDPPWIVVDHEPHSVIVPRWPGRLLRVASVPAGGDDERAALARAAENLRADAGYTRVFAVDVLAELSPAALFGPHGDAVIEVLEKARTLTEAQARDLAAARHPDADRAYSRAWDRWLAGQPNGERYRHRDFSRVLAVPGAGPVGSPIGHGFTVLRSLVSDIARRRAGSHAFTVDAEGDEVLAHPWTTAAAVLLDAGMAFGSPESIASTDATVLTAAWHVTASPGGSSALDRGSNNHAEQ